MRSRSRILKPVEKTNIIMSMIVLRVLLYFSLEIMAAISVMHLQNLIIMTAIAVAVHQHVNEVHKLVLT